MLSGRDIVIIASVDWRPLWQTPQEVASRLAAAGNRVLYIENTGVRAPNLRDLRRVSDRIHRWWSGREAGVTPDSPDRVWVHSPVVLPALGPRWQRWLNRRLLLPAVARTAERLGFREPLVWTWLPTDTALDLAGLLTKRGGSLIYFCIADFAPLVRRPRRLRRLEPELLSRSDLVLAHTEAFADRCRPLARELAMFPPSVSLEAFAFADPPAAPPEHPVIGYVGGVHDIVDLELLAVCAAARPAWRWRLVGPVQRDISILDGLDNVEVTGPQAHDELGRAIAGFDVAIVPYGHSDASVTVAPTKINEYLAVGRPVVATDLPWVVAFQREHGVLRVTPPEPESFMTAIEEALLAAPDPAAARRRRSVAELAGWDQHLERACEAIEAMERSRGSRREPAAYPQRAFTEA